MRPALAAPVALAALLGALALVAPASAAPPLEQPWTVELGGAGVGAGAALSVSLDAGGGRILVGTADRQAVGPADADLVHIVFDQGNVSVETDQNDVSPLEGKAAVAISGDGNHAIAAGNYSGNDLPNGGNIFYYNLPDMRAAWSRTKVDAGTTAAISHDGQVAAVGTRNVTTSVGRVYRFNARGDQVWQAGMDRCGTTQGSGGSVLAMDMSRDGRWLVVGSTFAAVDGPRGCVQLFDTGSFNPVASFIVPFVGNGDVTAVDITPDGAFWAAGTSGGRLYLFDRASANQPLSEGLPNLAPVVGVRVANDGSAVVAADGATVARYLRGLGVLPLDWSAPLQGVRSIDATPDGEYIVAGASQVTGFHRGSNATLWTIDMGGAVVKVARNGTTDVRIVAAAGSQVRAFRLHYAFDVRKVEPEPVAVQVGQARTASLEIVNSGSGLDTFELSALSQGFAVNLDPLQLSLRPGQAGNTTLTITPFPASEARLYTIEVGIRGITSGAQGSAVVNATLGAVPGLSLALADPGQRDKAVFQGEDHSFVLQVQNTGNAQLQLAYDVTQRPNVGGPWEVSLSRTSGVVEPGGVSSNTLFVKVPLDAKNGTENFINVSARGEGVQEGVQLRLVVAPFFTAALEVIPQSKVVAPGKSVSYTVVVANNGTLREQYRMVFCVALPDLIPCVGNATLGLGGWSVALDTSPFSLDLDRSTSRVLTVAAPRGAIPRVDRLTLQVEVISNNPDHKLRDTKLVVTSVVEDVPQTPPKAEPGFEAVAAVAGLAAVAYMARRRR